MHLVSKKKVTKLLELCSRPHGIFDVGKPNSTRPKSTFNSVRASLALLQKGHFVFEKTMTLFALIAADAVSEALIDSDFFRIPLKLCLMLLREKNATDVDSMMTNNVIWAKSFILFQTSLQVLCCSGAVKCME